MFSVDLFTFKETHISLCHLFALFPQRGSAFGYPLDMKAPPVAAIILQQEVLFGYLFEGMVHFATGKCHYR